jgi:hypothetical protein
MELSAPLLAGLKVAGGPQLNDAQFNAVVRLAVDLLPHSTRTTAPHDSAPLPSQSSRTDALTPQSTAAVPLNC